MQHPAEHQPWGSTRKRVCPNSTGWAFSTHTSRITPWTSDSISFMIFIASMMHTIIPGDTRVPTSTHGPAPGGGGKKNPPPAGAGFSRRGGGGGGGGAATLPASRL